MRARLQNLLTATLLLFLPSCHSSLDSDAVEVNQGDFVGTNGNIVFSRFVAGNLFDIFLVSENGLGLTNLTNDPYSNGNPRWSPNAKLIAYQSNRGGTTNIFIMTPRGENITNVSQMDRSVGDFDWSPDNKKIVFQGETVFGVDIYLVDITTLERINLTNGTGINSYPRFSHDGSKIAFVSKRDGIYGLYIMNPNGSNPVRISDITGFDATFTLTWSPDSKKLLFNFNTDGNRDIVTINADGSNRKNLTNNPADDVGGDWSPDGKYIVFQSNRSGVPAVYRMDADGSNVSRITSAINDTNPQYSPEGNSVLFLTARRGAYEIWVVDPGGLHEDLVTPTSISDRTPRWKPKLSAF